MKQFKYKLFTSENWNKPDEDWIKVMNKVGFICSNDFNSIIATARKLANETGFVMEVHTTYAVSEDEEGDGLVGYWNVSPFAKGRYTK